MTTLDEQAIICGVCGASQECVVLQSSNTRGAPDLDTRPSEMLRSTIRYWVQRCTECGCCASDIAKCSPELSNLIQSEDYKEILAHPRLPETAASFMASSHICERKEDYPEAAWGAINAAWFCDDKNDSESAIYCRKKALSLIATGKQNSQCLAEDTLASETITIDLLRRVGNFPEAMELIVGARKLEMNDLMQQIVDYEEVLVKAHDTACHTVDEAMRKKSPSEAHSDGEGFIMRLWNSLLPKNWL